MFIRIVALLLVPDYDEVYNRGLWGWWAQLRCADDLVGDGCGLDLEGFNLLL